MAAARHASRGDEKRGDQAAVSPLRLIVETRKRDDLEPGLAHGGARAAPRVSFAEALLRGACGAWHHDAAMGELELTRTPGDRRLYVLADVGTVRLKGWASRAARAEANGRTWEIARRGLWRPVVEATDGAGRAVGQFRARMTPRLGWPSAADMVLARGLGMYPSTVAAGCDGGARARLGCRHAERL